jgi:mannose-6-phosphate isomerase
MAIELARTQALPKPWGVADLGPWSHAPHDAGPIGEIWFQRADKLASTPSLLLKLLFTSEPLSIQVHPDDAYAQSIGLPHGKSEAWYVLSAASDAKLAVGLDRRLTRQELRQVIDDGSIANIVAWRTVIADDAISVPAGTIHAVGAGLVIAEIQQRSDATFRLFDHGRQRELHVDRAIEVADAGPSRARERQNRLSDERTLLVSGPHFVLERIELAPDSHWCLEAKRETWCLVVSGDAVAGSFNVAIGDAVFAQLDRVDIHAGKTGMVGLVAYTGIGPIPNLLRRLAQAHLVRPPEPRVAAPLTRAKVASTDSRLETTK